jgi:hypothetical protein
MEAFFAWSRSDPVVRRLQGMGVKANHNPSHCFGVIIDLDANPLGQACHVDGHRGEGQMLVHFGSKQPSTKVYVGEHPSVEELYKQAGVDADSLKADVKEILQDTTWAFLGRPVLEASMQHVWPRDKSLAGDATILAGPVPHAGPPTETARILGFCAVGGIEEHNPDEQFNPWNVAAMMVSPKCLMVAMDYWDHKPYMCAFSSSCVSRQSLCFFCALCSLCFLTFLCVCGILTQFLGGTGRGKTSRIWPLLQGLSAIGWRASTNS